MTKQEMTQEAIGRIRELTAKYHLNPNILKYFEQGRVYYSYLTAGGMIASIDTISYDPRYEKAVHDFERKYKYLVFHAIEFKAPYGEFLSLLYVSTNKENWAGERLYKDYIASYTINLAHPDCSEFGDIMVGAFGESGALLRIG